MPKKLELIPQLLLNIETFEKKDLTKVVKRNLNDLPFLKQWSPRVTQQHEELISSNPLISSKHCRIDLNKETIPLHCLLRAGDQSQSPFSANSHLITESQESKLTQSSPVNNVRPLWTKRGPMHWDRIYTSVS
jgi:hypothetical protein